MSEIRSNWFWVAVGVVLGLVGCPGSDIVGPGPNADGTNDSWRVVGEDDSSGETAPDSGRATGNGDGGDARFEPDDCEDGPVKSSRWRTRGAWPSLHGGPSNRGRSPERGPDGSGDLTKLYEAAYTSPNFPTGGTVAGDGSIQLGGIWSGVVSVDRDGTEMWRVGNEDEAYSASPVVGANGVFAVTMDRKESSYPENALLRAVGGDGEGEWRRPLDGTVVARDEPVLNHSGVGTAVVDSNLRRLLVGTRGRLEAFDISTGDRQWSLEFDTDVPAKPALDRCGRIFVAAGSFHAIAPSGNVLWSHSGRATDEFVRSPAVGDNGRLFVSAFPLENGTAALYAFDPRGRLEWRFDFDSGSHPKSSPTVGDDGSLYVSDRLSGKKLHAIEVDGSHRWSRQIDRYGVPRAVNAPIVDSAGRIIVSGTSEISAFQPSGDRLWRFDSTDEIKGRNSYESPFLAGVHGVTESGEVVVAAVWDDRSEEPPTSERDRNDERAVYLLSD